MPKDATEKGQERRQALVVARLLGHVGEVMAQRHHGEAKPAVFGGAGEQDFGHRQAGEFRVGELGLAPGQAAWPTEQIVDGDAERDEQGSRDQPGFRCRCYRDARFRGGGLNVSSPG